MADRVVIDASVALKWQFRDETETDQTLRMLTDFKDGRLELISPDLFAYEIANAIHIAVAKGRLPEEEGVGAISDILSVGITLYEPADVGHAFTLARTYGRSVYDCAYLSLAMKEGCFLYTADKRLFNALKGRLDCVRWVGDY